MVSRILIFLEMIKFEHSLFALPFAYSGMLLAGRGWPELYHFFWITAAMVSFRSMAMGANRLIDRPLDALNPRTKNRALPSRRLGVRAVWLLSSLFLLLFLFSAFLLGPLCFVLAPVPVVLAWLYPYLKRFTWLSHGCLGIILGIAPYGAWLAIRPEFSPVPGFLGFGVAAWVAGFDILYALQDVEFDRDCGLHSFPVRWGSSASLIWARIFHGVAFAAWIVVGWLSNLGFMYGAGLLVVGYFLAREHWLVHVYGLTKIEDAFFKANIAVSAGLFAAICLEGVVK